MKLTLLRPDLRISYFQVETRQRVKPEVWNDPKRKNGPYFEADFYDWTGPCELSKPAESLQTANGLMFHCPKCWGTPEDHCVLVSFVGCPAGAGSQSTDGKDSRWTVSGTSLENLTLNPSVWLKNSKCGWHGWIKNGDAT